jgi:hypothetical protein
MATAIHVRARVIPWDDAAFVKAFERALETTHETGVHDDAAGSQVQELLREAGYPHATVTVTRTVKEALEDSSSWLVRREG